MGVNCSAVRSSCVPDSVGSVERTRLESGATTCLPSASVTELDGSRGPTSYAATTATGVEAEPKLLATNETSARIPCGRADVDMLLTHTNIAEYTRAAMKLPHPLRERGSLDDDLVDVVKRTQNKTTGTLDDDRRRALFDISNIKNSLPPPPRRKGLPIPNAPLFKFLLVQTGYDDAEAADLCNGAPILGTMGGPLAWPRQVVHEPTKLRPEIIQASAAERAAFLASVKPGRFDQTLWDESRSDVKKGRMCGPFWSTAEVAQSLRTWDFVISRRFGVEQTDKVRPCDDFTRSYVNDGVHVNRKLRLSGLDSFFALAYAMLEGAGADRTATRTPRQNRRHAQSSGLKFWRRDHEGAYRQIPIVEEDQPPTVVVFCDPVSGKLVFFYHKALPFGATASVYGYNRVSRAVVFLARKLLDIPVDSYFDDFWCVDRADRAKASFDAFADLNVLLGFAIKEKKDVLPTCSDALLGIQVNITSVPFSASITTERSSSLQAFLRKSLQLGRLSPASAATLAGRMNFAETAMFGRVGRAPLRAVYARQFQPCDRSLNRYALTASLRAALQALLLLLDSPPPRVIPVPWTVLAPVTLFTDGEGYGSIGGVLLTHEAGGRAFAFSSKVTNRVIRMLHARRNQIALIELLAVLTAVDEFAELLRGRDVRIFIDNVVAEASIRNGYMRRDSRDACVLVAALWQKFLQLQINVWVDRVPSRLNIADGPSRPDKPELLQPLYDLGFPVQWSEDVQVPVWAREALKESLALRSV